ncbi:DUF2264 domain-containing protein [Blautia producta]|uniref:DUF2264 domain-containing protein n=1 Tax=Blautia producta TaxID=33035 RepID=UPI0031B5748D
MIQTRDELADYAMHITIPLWERAERRKQDLYSEISDNAGYSTSWIENFCRPFWGIGPVLLEKGGQYTLNTGSCEEPLIQWIRRTMVEGTDPQSPYYWDRVERIDISNVVSNQVKTEMAGLLTGVYFAREIIWDPLKHCEKKQIADWIFHCTEVAYKECYPNNHYWFCVLNFLILKKLGFSYEGTEQYIRSGLEKLDALYIGNGWYQDGEFGRFDYYIPWALHSYPMLWTLIEDESFEGYQERKWMYIERTKEFLPSYAHCFDKTGSHIPFGRSLSYRYAASGIFPLAVLAGCHFDPGLARNIVLKNINYFVGHLSIRDDEILPPGFLYFAPGVIENYTSDGGPYWCAKAFWALLLPEDHAFWQAPLTPLPIEQGPYKKNSGHEKIHMLTVGEGEINGVTLYNNTANYLQHGKKEHFFNDMGGLYSKFAYNSRSGFGLSTRDMVSLDNMIGLVTRDRTLWSHRMGFTDIGESDGVLESSHIPFANDPDTVIHTWLLPLSKGWHVRIHNVRISRPYSIVEGGFSVGLKTDRRVEKSDGQGASVEADGAYSVIHTQSSVPIHFFVREVQPGMHLLRPFALYPCYETKEVCKKGSYTFVSAFGFFDKGVRTPAPVIHIEESQVTVSHQGTLYCIKTEKRGRSI